jgi:hypothetical protein
MFCPVLFDAYYFLKILIKNLNKVVLELVKFFSLLNLYYF